VDYVYSYTGGRHIDGVVTQQRQVNNAQSPVGGGTLTRYNLVVGLGGFLRWEGW
jgi:hypothetical protein